MIKKKSKKIFVVSGARPNFIKINLLMRQMRQVREWDVKLVHTGQHYDFQMSDVFFKELKIATPDFHLGVKGGTHATQTAEIMTAFEALVIREKPSLVVVVGDVNSTLACALVCAKIGVRIAHVEAGLRSFDRTMPEEINRIVTDQLSDLCFVSEPSGLKNLKKEGISPKKIFWVGNTMIDTLVDSRPLFQASSILKKLTLKAQSYAVTTLHRPSNVDCVQSLEEIYEVLSAACRRLPVVYPIHPRSKQNLIRHGLFQKFLKLKNLQMIDPLGYVDFMTLVSGCRFVLTDSGGVQEETTFLKIPCLTMRENTERPITTQIGTNVLVGRHLGRIQNEIKRILSQKKVKGQIPRYWDGLACKRIVSVLKKNR